MLIMVVAIIVAMSAITAAVWSDTSTPGSETDPVVTKSYVDSKTTFATLQLTAGQRLIGGEGAEIILRSGEATAIDNGANGVSDITLGTDLMTGNQVGLNHLLLVPRSDGRGIVAQTDVWIMIRGAYTIQ